MLAALGGTPARSGAVFIPIVVPIPVTLPSAQTGGYDQIHTIAVLSSLGDTMQLQNVHFVGTKSRTLNIADWNQDGVANSLLQNYLSSRFTVKTVSYDRAAIAALPNGPFENSRVKLQQILGKIANDGIDAFMVIRPDLEYQAPGVEGIALVNGNGMGDPPPIIWANYEIDLVDAHSYATIAKAYSRVSYRLGDPASFANIIAPDILKLNDTLDLTADQSAVLHTYSARLLSASIVETLRALDMGLQLPVAGARTLIPIPADKKPFQTVKSVAVYSVIGDDLNLEFSGAFFAHDSYAVPVPDWKVDDEVRDLIAGSLDKRFTVKPVIADMTALRQAHVVNDKSVSDPAFPGLTPSQDVDLYIVAVKFRHTCPVGQHDCEGVGMVHLGALGNTATRVFASYAIAVIDAHTLKWLSWRGGLMPPDFASDGPYETIPDETWPSKPPALTPDQMTTIHTALDDVIKHSIPETVMGLGLSGMMVQRDTAPPPAPAQASPATAH